MQQEQQWAQALHKQRRQKRQAKTLDLDVQEQKRTHDIERFTTALKEAAGHGDKEQMDALLKQLITARAELAVIALAKEQEDFGELDDVTIEDELEAYLHDTYALGAAVKQQP